MFPYFIKDKISSMKAPFITLLILFYFRGEAKFPIIFASAGIYLLKGNNRNNRARRVICSKITIKTPERCQLRRSDVFIVNFEHISHLVLVYLLLTLNMELLTGCRVL